MMNYLIKTLIILFLFYSKNLFSEDVEKIIFSLENDYYTTIDLDQRIEYLKILTLNNSKLKYNEYLNDYISVIIFDKFSKLKKITVDKEIIDNYLTNIIEQYQSIDFQKYNEIKNNAKTIKILKDNIRYDYQRKIVLENILSIQKNENIFNTENDLLNIYNYRILYFTFNEFNKRKKINDILNLDNIEKTKILFDHEKINYSFFIKEINSFNNIDKEIKEKILKNKNDFYLEKDEYFIIGKIIKEIKDNIDLKYTFYQIIIPSNKEINKKILKCENIESINKIENIKIKSYNNVELKKVSDLIKNNLININDILVINSNDSKSYVILCKFDYNKKLTTDIIVQEKIDKKVQDIENEFIKEKKINFQFKNYE